MEFIAGDTQKITISQPGSGTALVSGVLVDRVAILITTLVVAFSCCWSTAKFDVAVHEFALFQAAPDEPFYLSLAAGAPLSLDYRFASRILIAALRAVGNHKLRLDRSRLSSHLSTARVLHGPRRGSLSCYSGHHAFGAGTASLPRL
jgi:hypothetical protein